MVIISPFQCDPKGSSKAGAGKSHRSSGNPQMANSGMVLDGNCNENADQLPSSPTAQCQATSVTQPHTRSTSTTQETGPSHLHFATYQETVACKRAFQKQLQTSSCVPGEIGPKINTRPTLQSGKITATPKGLVQFQRL